MHAFDAVEKKCDMRCRVPKNGLKSWAERMWLPVAIAYALYPAHRVSACPRSQFLTFVTASSEGAFVRQTR